MKIFVFHIIEYKYRYLEFHSRGDGVEAGVGRDTRISMLHTVNIIMAGEDMVTQVTWASVMIVMPFCFTTRNDDPWNDRNIFSYTIWK